MSAYWKRTAAIAMALVEIGFGALPEVPDDGAGAILWKSKREASIRDYLSKPKEETIAGLGEMLRQLKTLTYRECEELNDVTTKLQAALLGIPGHAEYFGKRIRDAYEPLKDPNPGVAIYDAGNEMMYSFATLKNLPSPETVKVLGDMLSDTWRLTPPPPIPDEVSYTPGSLALSAVESALIYLPLREPPKIPPVMAGEDPEVVMVHPWQSWYAEVKSGRHTFSFKGKSVEYRFNPDGTWETLAMANPPDDGPKPESSKPEAMRPEKSPPPPPPPPPPAPEPPAPPSSAPTTSPSIYGWIIGCGILVLAAVGVFLKRRHAPK